MESDAILGCIIAAASLAVLAALVFWSRRRIERIARNGFGTPRQIEKERRNNGA